MAKELKSAEALADMVKAELAMAGLRAAVSPERTVGWTADVITPPTDALAVQLKVDVIASKLRARLDLRNDKIIEKGLVEH
jgi:hypothetical protein